MDAAIAETHLSVVVFVGDRAYKLKKPLKLPFADFSTLEARRAGCEREVALNRRLAPDVYLGVADVTGPDGRICDHLVVMRRMPEERRLSTLVRRGDDVDAELRRAAELLAGFHATATCSDVTSAAGTVEMVRRNWTDNTEEMRPFVGQSLGGDVVEQVSALALRYLDGRAPLFEQRLAEQRVRDGHGDLLADDIFCLADGPRILDCIEFDDRLRYGDTLADVAFLSMDLERLGRRDLGERFLSFYSQRSGDRWPRSLADHYVAYRAQVRTKVACIRYKQGDPEAAVAATALLEIALAHLQRARITLVLVGGLPGSGKSTLAAALADTYGWRLLCSDVVRKELAGISPEASARAPLGEGMYRREQVDRTYRELADRARRHLGFGEPVIVDASWTYASHRSLAAEVADQTSSDLVQICCTAPAAVREPRLAKRAAAGRDASDADAAIAEALAAEADPWPAAAYVEASGSIEAMVSDAREVIDSRLGWA